MKSDAQRKLDAILQVLAAAGGQALGATAVAEDLERRGFSLRQRMVRNYLMELDRRGLTENLGRPGRRLTAKGLSEVDVALVAEKAGYTAAKMDEQAYAMACDLQHHSGSIILNVSRFSAARFAEAQRLITRVLDAGLGMGRYVGVGLPGGSIGGYRVPAGSVAVGTLSSVTLNGILRQAGIPTVSKFGGLLEMCDGTPRRFSQIIHYEGTTIDPVELFIKARMTRVLQVAMTGTGAIGASFREIPATARAATEKLLASVAKAGLGGIQLLGRPGEPLLDIPVAPRRCGLVVAAGLNPLAAVEEAGIETCNHTMGCLAELRDLLPAEEWLRLPPPPVPEPARPAGTRISAIDLNRLRSAE